VNLRNVSLMLLMGFNLGCAEIATNVAIQGGIQFTGEQYLISQNKPVTRCNLYNVMQGNKMCRIYKQYRRA
jgi:hypothetical protein